MLKELYFYILTLHTGIYGLLKSGWESKVTRIPERARQLAVRSFQTQIQI
jgi:hypothetical protein